MLKGFSNFLIKELKELIRDPKIFLGMIIVPLLMFPVLGAVMNFSVESAKESASKTTVLILNHDTGDNSTQFIAYLSLNGPRVFNVNASTIGETVALLPAYNATEIIEIPSDFTQNVTTGKMVDVQFYSVFSGAGLLEGVSSSIVDAAIVNFNRKEAPDIVIQKKSSIVKGEVVNFDPRTLASLMLSQAIAMPITLMILLSYSMQIAATSVAMEKEEKTLETLLTLPMDRFAILAGKLSGSIIVAGVGAIAYMIGFNYYLGSFSSITSAGGNVDLASLGLVPSLFGYLLLGISLFVALLSALALAVIISSFAEDVRSAQSVVGYIYPFIFLPALALMYLDVNTMPLAFKILIYAIPYSHPIIAAKAVTMGDYLTAGLGIVYVAAFTLVVMYVASRLFATEKILTAKLKFKGLRRSRKGATEEYQ